METPKLPLLTDEQVIEVLRDEVADHSATLEELEEQLEDLLFMVRRCLRKWR